MRKDLEDRVVNFLKSQNKEFINACTVLSINPSRRQASKWINQKGIAWNKVGRFKT